MSQGISQKEGGGGKRALFLGVGLVAGTLIGLGLGRSGLLEGSGGPLAKTPPASGASLTFAGGAGSAPPGGAALDALLDPGGTSGSDRTRLVLAYVDGLGPDDLAGRLDEVLARRRGNGSYDLISSLYQKWVEHDPAAALLHAGELEGRDRKTALSVVLSAWAAKAPYEAIAWMEEHGNPRETQSGAYAALRAIAADNPEAAIELFGNRRATLMPSTNSSFLYAIWAEQDPHAAAAGALAIPSAQERDHALQSLTIPWARRDPQAAWEWGNSLERTRDRDGVLRSVISAVVGEGDTSQAIAFLEGMEPGKGRRSALDLIVSSMAETDPESAYELARSGGAASGRDGQAYSSLFYRWARTDPARAFEVAFGELDPGDVRNSAIQSIINEVAGRDLPLAREMLQQLDPEAMRNATHSVARAFARNDVARALAWADGFAGGEAKSNAYSVILSEWAQDDPRAAAAYGLAMADEPLRSRTLPGVLSTWASQDAVGAMIWAVENLEAKDQENYIPGTLLGSWADQDLAGAAEWVAALPEGNLRSQSVSNLISSWSQHDIAGAGDWLNRLKPGEGRDEAVKRYASTVFEIDPEAALIWAGSIAAEEDRASQIEQLARRYLRNDPARARRWIAASTLPPAKRDELLQEAARN